MADHYLVWIQCAPGCTDEAMHYLDWAQGFLAWRRILAHFHACHFMCFSCNTCLPDCFFPQFTLILLFFFLLFCDQRDTDASCSRLSAVSTDTGFDRRRRRDPYEPCEALHSLHSVYTGSAFYSQVDFHTILGNVFSCLKCKDANITVLWLTISQEEDEILCDVLIESLDGQRILQCPLGPIIPKLGILFWFCAQQ